MIQGERVFVVSSSDALALQINPKCDSITQNSGSNYYFFGIFHQQHAICQDIP
jgi:hypothetical protein